MIRNTHNQDDWMMTTKMQMIQLCSSQYKSSSAACLVFTGRVCSFYGLHHFKVLYPLCLWYIVNQKLRQLGLEARTHVPSAHQQHLPTCFGQLLG